MELWFDGKSSLTHFGLDLQNCYITAPKRKKHLIDVLCADGAIDAMQGFEPTYENRTITASFKILGSGYETRDRILNELEGRTVPIVLPDDIRYYMIGEPHVSASGFRPGDPLTITAVCLPWRYARNETVYEVDASETDVQYRWRNAGKRYAVPEITVQSEDVILTIDGNEKTLVSGTYLLSELGIPGFSTIIITARGGAFTARYREAIL